MLRRYKVGMLVIFILLLLTVILEIHYQTYLGNKLMESPLIEVKEGLSINYLHGKVIQVSGTKKEVSFSLTNHSTSDMTYYVESTHLKGNYEGATYSIFNGEEEVKQKTSLSYHSILSNVTIKPNETQRFIMKIESDSNVNFSFRLHIDLAVNDKSFASAILKDNQILESDNSFEQIQGMTGFIHKKEEVGDTYFFRGNVDNNYVFFANNMWRIVKLNEDRSVKLILDGVTESLETMNTEEMVGNTNYETTNVYQKLNDWYNLQLKDYDRVISSTIYCYDDSILVDNEGEISYLALHRLSVDHLPTNSCSGSSISTKIALLTADEAMYAGAGFDNNEYFLDLESLQTSWWTMTPSKKSVDEVFYLTIDKDGVLQHEVSEKSALFLRPVITITPKTEVVGLGTKEYPYQLSIQ